MWPPSDPSAQFEFLAGALRSMGASIKGHIDKTSGAISDKVGRIASAVEVQGVKIKVDDLKVENSARIREDEQLHKEVDEMRTRISEMTSRIEHLGVGAGSSGEKAFMYLKEGGTYVSKRWRSPETAWLKGFPERTAPDVRRKTLDEIGLPS